MNRRLRLVPKPVAFVITWPLLILLGVAIVYLVQVSVNGKGTLRDYLNSNAVVEVGGAIVLGLVAAVFSLRKGFAVRVPVFGDHRRTVLYEELPQLFDVDASTRPTMEAGWHMAGRDQHMHSAAIYQADVGGLFSVSAEFKPLRSTAANNYWRAGFSFRRANESPVAEVHLDNHNLVVGYLNNHLQLRLPANMPLEGRWSLLGMDLSTGDTPNTVRVFCHLNRLSWFVGDVVEAGPYPWRLSIRAWSDEHRGHSVLIRDIAIMHNLA
jgi:hypothetical protein